MEEETGEQGIELVACHQEYTIYSTPVGTFPCPSLRAASGAPHRVHVTFWLLVVGFPAGQATLAVALLYTDGV